MKIAVITPYCGEPDDWLAECHESVKRQTLPTTHILVADGQPSDLASSFESGIDYHHKVCADFPVPLDPIYEAKCIRFLRPEDLLWIVGIRNCLG